MKHELLILRSLLVASLIVCGLILGNMLSYTGSPTLLASVGTTTAVAASCALPSDGIVCAPTPTRS